MKPTYKDRINQIRPLLEKHYTSKQGAAEIGVSIAYATKLIRTGRQEGLLPDNRKHNPLRYMSVGALGQEIKNQGPSFTRWLQRTMPEGTTIASFAVACMLDTYYEELDS